VRSTSAPPVSTPTSGYGQLDVSAAYQLLACAPDLTVATSPSSATVLPAGAVAHSVSVTSANGLVGNVSLSLDGLSVS
jgi:hypothetical protein